MLSLDVRSSRDGEGGGVGTRVWMKRGRGGVVQSDRGVMLKSAHQLLKKDGTRVRAERKLTPTSED